MLKLFPVFFFCFVFMKDENRGGMKRGNQMIKEAWEVEEVFFMFVCVCKVLTRWGWSVRGESSSKLFLGYVSERAQQ